MRKSLIASAVVWAVFGSLLFGQLTFPLPQVANGQSGNLAIRFTFILNNPNTQPVTATITLTRDDASPLTVTIPGQGTNSSFTVHLASGQTVMLQTDGSGPLTVGAALVTTAQSIGVSGIFSIYQDGVFVTEAGVGSPAPSSSFVIPVDSQGPASTGLALFNYGSCSANVTLQLVNLNGSQPENSTKTLTLDSRRHVAKFITGLNEFYPELGAFRGTLVVKSNRPLSALTLRQNAQPLSYTTLPVVPTISPKMTFLLSEIANGTQDSLVFKTTFIVFNISANAGTVTVTTRKGIEGSAFPVTIPGVVANASSFQVSLAAGASAFLQTDGSGPLSPGAASITSTVPIGLAAIYTLAGPSGFITEAGVADSAAEYKFTVPADVTPGFDTAVALYYPGTGSTTVTVTRVSGEGAPQGSPYQIVLSSGGHVARHVTEFFPGTANFRGALSIAATAPVAATGIRLTAAPTVYTTLPVIGGGVGPVLWADWDVSVGQLLYVGAGTFRQGAVDEACQWTDETPFSHRLVRNLAVMETEVSQQMWEDLKTVRGAAFDLPNPSNFKSSPNLPVEQVTWLEALLFANELSVAKKLTRVYYRDAACTQPIDKSNYYITDQEQYMLLAADGFRLPTEGEWEYFTRAGTQSPFSVPEPNYNPDTCAFPPKGTLAGLERVAWFGKSELTTYEVGLLEPNPWGLKDVHGNVCEWCWDRYGEYPTGTPEQPQVDYRGGNGQHVFRGGAYGFFAADVRSARRMYAGVANRVNYCGFRLVRTVN